MSALGFFGGLAGAYQGIQKGYDDAKTRDEIDKRRKWAEEDQAWQTESRGMLREKSNRELAEARRQDERRAKIAALPKIGDDVDAPATPSAIEMPAGEVAAPRAAVDKITPPAQELGDRGAASVETPAVQASTSAPFESAPAKKLPTRKYTYADHLRDLAKIEQQGGNAEGSVKLSQAASDWNLKQAGQRLNSLIASSNSLSDQELASNAASMFNDDPLPAQVRNLKANSDGSFTGTIYGTDSGRELPVKFKDRNEMLRGLQAHYQPENFSKLQMSAEEARIKAQAELDKARAESLYKPSSVGRGGLYVPDGKGGGTVIGGDGAAGAAAGSGKAGKAADPSKPYNDAFEMAATKGETKLTPNQIADGNRVVSQLASAGYDQGTAVKVALDVAMDPTKTRLELNHQTGEVDRIYRNPDINRGKAIVVSSGAGSIKDMEKQAGGPGPMKEAVGGMISNMLAAIPEQSRQAAQSKLVEVANEPTMRKQYLQAAQAAGKDVEVIDRQLSLIAAYVKPAAAATSAAPAAANQSILDRLRSTGGMVPKTDPNSQAGRFQARQEQAKKEAEDKARASAEASAVLSTQFQKDKAAMDPLEFARKYDAVRSRLSREDALELRRIEQGL